MKNSSGGILDVIRVRLCLSSS